MTDGDKGITIFLGVVGVVALAMGSTTVGIIFVVISALMVGMAWGSQNK